ncbi:hypothetical protein [Pseudobacteriovorax antillogorgiicola]|uniref:Uncharacterized protein n=1 Tax=Pseudobacteriovorax antillogorgiicola TaxID=1513793 RepID=A0A1Y6CPA5_9BACT|nr:hypothetical protein [Pseudobacteriovorax antillogorgiicola]TCS44237.1 hypothetical protein EDD56_13437 [Pseudobacteriovorax antillogorgiicola]SMF80667.1 hypothetical protein SAMN06296036_13538 [Pseudobacteriovorax antillogorgiicola]
MPVPGDTYSSLTLIREVGSVKHGRNNVKVWLCQCTCGRQLDVNQASLVKGEVPACKVCRRGPCVICGSEIENESFSVKRNTCSEECRKEQARRKSLKAYSKKVLKAPAHNREIYQRRLENDPAHNKERYARMKEREKDLSQEARDAIRTKRNRDSNNWRRLWLEEIKEKDPKKYQEWLRSSRKRRNEHYKKKELLSFMALSEKLKSKVKGDQDENDVTESR